MDTAPRTSTMTTPTDRSIHIERVFDAPRDVLWRALTEPELVAQWWGRGNPLDVERLEVELARIHATRVFRYARRLRKFYATRR